VKIFYGESYLFIGARGAVSRTRLDLTVARFPEDACPLRRSEGDVFTEIQKFSWNQLVLGNSGKTYHPRNVELDEIHEMSF
jgi:hypothetical protein